jgi:hypothetical protein
LLPDSYITPPNKINQIVRHSAENVTSKAAIVTIRAIAQERGFNRSSWLAVMCVGASVGPAACGPAQKL